MCVCVCVCTPLAASRRHSYKCGVLPQCIHKSIYSISV